jgi:predicted phosphodiesterase
MRVLIISDIHANLTALETVLEDAGQVDATWCLGDLVGYGPDPNECVDLIQTLPNLVCLLGNHDAAAIGQLNIDTFNPEARNSIEWQQDVLEPEQKAYLQSLPTSYVNEQATLVHGSPRSPVFEYLLDNQLATENFPHFSTPYCFFGHTHLPSQFYLSTDQVLAKLIIPKPNTEFKLLFRTIINPGSVGQPRDRDPRASYAIFDSEKQTWAYRRIRYDIAAVQARMASVHLPERHIQRLEIGW